MKAMIFAAGLGTRLRPMTDHRPKALIPVFGKPMLEWIILRLKMFGITDIIINVHHFADQIIRFLQSKNNFHIKIEISKEDKLLDTGGGLKKAAWFFTGESDFLVHNTDVLSDIDLSKMYVHHKETNSIVTLSTRTRKTDRYLLFDEDNKLCGWQNMKDDIYIWTDEPAADFSRQSFCGIHIISSQILRDLNSIDCFPIIPDYLRLAKKHKISSFSSDPYKWYDLGKAENIYEVPKILTENYFSALEKQY